MKLIFCCEKMVAITNTVKVLSPKERKEMSDKYNKLI